MKITIVDDNNGLRGMLADSLRRKGHDVYEASSTKWIDWSKIPDLAIIDYMMSESGEDGIDVARQMRHYWSNVPLVGWTAGDDRMVELFRVEVDIVIRKPMKTSRIIRTIEAAAHSE